MVFKLSQNKESYIFSLSVKEEKNYEDLPNSIFERSIMEANRFIDFYFIDPSEFYHRMNLYRKVVASSRHAIPQFTVNQANQLKKQGLIAVNGFTLECVRML